MSKSDFFFDTGHQCEDVLKLSGLVFDLTLFVFGRTLFDKNQLTIARFDSRFSTLLLEVVNMSKFDSCVPPSHVIH